MTFNKQPHSRLIKTTSSLTFATILAITLAIVLSACGMFENKELPDYLKSKSTPALTVSDGLQVPAQNRQYNVPDTGEPAPVTLEDLEKLEQPPEVDSALLTEMDTEEAEKLKSSEGETLKVRTARNTEGYDLLVVEADFDLSWDRVGEALKKIGFKIEDRDRGNQLYVIYQEIIRETTEEEEFLRPRGEKGPREEYQIHIDDRETQTRITVHNQTGKPDDSALAKHLLVQLRSVLEKPPQ